MKENISLVSYLNTLPFIYGLENSPLKDNINIIKNIPSQCAEVLKQGQANIGLVPVAELTTLSGFNIVTDYCIGSENTVKSVLLLSDVPLHEIESVELDYQSKTSNNLIKILAKELWNKNFTYINTSPDYTKVFKENTASLIIGDRALLMAKRYPYQYDLAEEWKKLTDLPFVFAVWVANKNISEPFLNDFTNALQFGIQNISKAVASCPFNNEFKKITESYLKNNISYPFNAQKKQALELFIGKLTAF
ncbi:MAG: menaquinone biosynthesis protein [Bacteroidetes bacterium]|nr:radical SAM protein [Bacteroidota bacterium]MBV6461911.1 Chorismate dehydratase [Flavobacteriales bacterium]WKZ74481.1 MAG: menaquinone biosynthesis protein [Vicingaceae bacterium]MCL4816209.1 menaquinone biosynthesis protein [Flavobacteriales bacterium]NOG95095.1 menaquinone biosynthesis protein [Bacteroidota bacterium]